MRDFKIGFSSSRPGQQRSVTLSYSHKKLSMNNGTKNNDLGFIRIGSIVIISNSGAVCRLTASTGLQYVLRLS